MLFGFVLGDREELFSVQSGKIETTNQLTHEHVEQSDFCFSSHFTLVGKYYDGGHQYVFLSSSYAPVRLIKILPRGGTFDTLVLADICFIIWKQTMIRLIVLFDADS